jgi:hypothetical protein
VSCGARDAFHDVEGCRASTYAQYSKFRDEQIAAGNWDGCEESDGEAGEDDAPELSNEQYFAKHERGLYA